MSELRRALELEVPLPLSEIRGKTKIDLLVGQSAPLPINAKLDRFLDGELMELQLRFDRARMLNSGLLTVEDRLVVPGIRLPLARSYRFEDPQLVATLQNLSAHVNERDILYTSTPDPKGISRGEVVFGSFISSYGIPWDPIPDVIHPDSFLLFSLRRGAEERT